MCPQSKLSLTEQFSIYSSSPLVEEFTSRFPKMSLHNVLSEFSLPAPLSEHNNPLGLPQQQVCIGVGCFSPGFLYRILYPPRILNCMGHQRHRSLFPSSCLQTLTCTDMRSAACRQRICRNITLARGAILGVFHFNASTTKDAKDLNIVVWS